ncbi:MAG TPA: hypothetical protein VEW65_01835, partial [Chryseolinea sp.]|nr:hypothetical protein [Chryseolinea sp.]
MRNRSYQHTVNSKQLLRRYKNHKAKFLGCFMLYALCFMVIACTAKKEPALPIFGEREVKGTDTVYHTIADFKFVDQDSVEISNETYKDKIYVTDFF